MLLKVGPGAAGVYIGASKMADFWTAFNLCSIWVQCRHLLLSLSIQGGFPKLLKLVRFGSGNSILNNAFGTPDVHRVESVSAGSSLRPDPAHILEQIEQMPFDQLKHTCMSPKSFEVKLEPPVRHKQHLTWAGCDMGALDAT